MEISVNIYQMILVNILKYIIPINIIYPNIIQMIIIIVIMIVYII